MISRYGTLNPTEEEMTASFDTFTKIFWKWVFNELHEGSTNELRHPLFYFFDLSAVAAVATAGQLYIAPSKKLAGDNVIKQWLYPICCAVGITAPNIWASLKITGQIHPKSLEEQKIFKTILHPLREYIYQTLIFFAAWIAVLAFTEISLENTGGWFWPCDVSLARFFLQYFGLKQLLLDNRIHCVSNLDKGEKLIIVKIRDKIISLINTARTCLIQNNLAARKNMLSVRYADSNNIENYTDKGKELFQQLIATVNFESKNAPQRNFMNAEYWLSILGGVICILGMAGYGGKAYAAIGRYINYEILQIICTVFSMAPITYLIFSKSLIAFDFLFKTIQKLFNKEIINLIKTSSSIKLYPIATTLLIIFSMFFGFLSWPTNMLVTQQVFTNDISSNIFSAFSVFPSVSFNTFGLIAGLSLPLLQFIGIHSSNQDTKDLSDLAGRSTERFTEKLKQIPLEYILLLFDGLSNEHHSKIINGIIDPNSFANLTSKVKTFLYGEKQNITFFNTPSRNLSAITEDRNQHRKKDSVLSNISIRSES